MPIFFFSIFTDVKMSDQLFFKDPNLYPNVVNTSSFSPRILFVMTLNGRALRQVKRLLHHILHKDHMYYIHVDARMDYLYHGLKNATEKISNIYVEDERVAPVWGSSSLLDVLLRGFRKMSSFKYDFVINLSESDFLLKPLSQLVTLLSQHQGKSFLRGQVQNVPRFIRKQGMNRLFVECENRMWRVGQRDLPEDIVVNGGSDWFILSRPFVDYVLNSQSVLVKGLREFFTYTLLPAEVSAHY